LAGGAVVATSLVLTLALQSAVPPFATDTYTLAFPRVIPGLARSLIAYLIVARPSPDHGIQPAAPAT
jgi:hypothetical protein